MPTKTVSNITKRYDSDHCVFNMSKLDFVHEAGMATRFLSRLSLAGSATSDGSFRMRSVGWRQFGLCDLPVTQGTDGRLPSFDGHRRPGPEFMLSTRRSGLHAAGSCRQTHAGPRDRQRRCRTAAASGGSANPAGFGTGPWSRRAAPCGIVSVPLLYLPDLIPPICLTQFRSWRRA